MLSPGPHLVRHCQLRKKGIGLPSRCLTTSGFQSRNVHNLLMATTFNGGPGYIVIFIYLATDRQERSDRLARAISGQITQPRLKRKNALQ